jgi:hypothetical protein
MQVFQGFFRIALISIFLFDIVFENISTDLLQFLLISQCVHVVFIEKGFHRSIHVSILVAQCQQSVERESCDHALMNMDNDLGEEGRRHCLSEFMDFSTFVADGLDIIQKHFQGEMTQMIVGQFRCNFTKVFLEKKRSVSIHSFIHLQVNVQCIFLARH